MAVNIAPITFKEHANTKIKPLSDFNAFANRHISPLVVHEFSRAACSFPIVFIQEPESKNYKVVAMFSVQPNENKFVQDGKWTAAYLPHNFARGPFFISSDDKPVVCLNQGDDRVSETEGEALFNEKGEQSEYFKGIIGSIENLMQQEAATEAFIKKLVELELMRPSNLNIQRKDGSKHEVTGISIVDEEKFKNLTDEQVLQLNKSGFLGLIYIHLCSLGQIQNLLRD
ncbi:SapC family protein [Neiella marina]|uniref:SapC family protein n=1 Tax=Neiella holothuriorum TaxID=2870530 RepID=A0ABS7EDP2_9GAMM|nr:SapC family protein [Neiella holothuriorum]MBW8190461.1 SapC family protein [Neiella holothuriorum]